MNDYIVRILAKEAGVRGLACVTTGLVQEAARRHDASPVATAALGYGLTGAALLGALLKVQQRVALKVTGDGPLQKLLAESDSYGHVRGYVAVPEVPSPLEISPQTVAHALGRQGLLTVVKDVGLKDLHQGVIALESGELDKELIGYLFKSEQVPSFVEIGVDVDDQGRLVMAGGLLLQTLPGEDTQMLDLLVDRFDGMPVLQTLLEDGHAPEEIMARLFGDVEYEVLEQRPLTFRCTCGWERTKTALKLLGADEIRSLMEEGEAVIECHFCHETYVYTTEALETVLEEMEA